MGECKVKMGSYPNFSRGVQWTISGVGDHGMAYNDTVESWEITGCENHSVIFYEHGDHNRRQQAHTLTNGKYQRYNSWDWIGAHGPYASPLSGISAAKIKSPGGESIVNGGKINATIDIPDGRGPQAAEEHTVDNWDKYLKPNQDHGLSDHCPGATWKSWQHAKTSDKPTKALCQWTIDENSIASLAASNETHVKGIYNTIINRVCNAIKNDNPNFKTGKGNETCWDLVKTQDFMKDYCFKENRMSNDSLCSKSSLGNSYAIISEEYCKANPTADFCACYNVTKNLCTEQPDLPGCKIVQPIWDTIKETLEEGDIAQFEGMQPCYGSVCTGNVYQPTDWNANCNKNISICKADFKIGGDLVGSNISLKQDCGNTTNEGGGSGGGSGSGSSETTTTNNDDDDDDDDEEKTLIEKIFKLKEDKDKKFIEKRVVKVGGGILSLIFCLLCIITLIMFA